MDLQEQHRLQTIIRKDRSEIAKLKKERDAAVALAADLQRQNERLRDVVEQAGASPKAIDLIVQQAQWDATHPRKAKRA